MVHPHMYISLLCRYNNIVIGSISIGVYTPDKDVLNKHALI